MLPDIVDVGGKLQRLLETYPLSPEHSADLNRTPSANAERKKSGMTEIRARRANAAMVDAVY